MSELSIKEYSEIKGRMTKLCHIKCSDCPLSSTNNGMNMRCAPFECKYPEKAFAIIEEWGQKHPIVTNAQYYAEELRKLGFHVDETILKNRCPIHKIAKYSGKITCWNEACVDCRKWWDEDYITNDETKGE